MSDFRKLAHLYEQLGEDRFQVLISSDNTGKVKDFCDQLLKDALPTTMTVGDRTYDILGFLRGDETSVVGHTMVERAKRDRTPYDVWVKKGYISAVPGVSINYDYVAKDIANIVKDMDLRGIGFDRWRMDVLKKAFERIEAELPLEPFGQGFKDMSPALDFLEEKLLNRIVFHGGNPVLRMCAANAVVERDAAENRKFTKAKATGRIDGLVAMATAFGMVAKPEQESDSHEDVVQTLE